MFRVPVDTSGRRVTDPALAVTVDPLSFRIMIFFLVLESESRFRVGRFSVPIAAQSRADSDSEPPSP